MEHQHGHRFIVFLLQYGEHDVMLKFSNDLQGCTTQGHVRIQVTFGIRTQSSTDKDWNSIPEIRNLRHRIQNPRLS